MEPVEDAEGAAAYLFEMDNVTECIPGNDTIQKNCNLLFDCKRNAAYLCGLKKCRIAPSEEPFSSTEGSGVRAMQLFGNH